MALSAKRKQFINEYFECGFNATEAARRVGYKHPNKYGPILTSEPEIKEEIKARLEEFTLSANEVLYLLTKQAKTNAADYVDRFGIIDWEKLKRDGIQVKGIKHQRGQSSFDLYDAQSALTLIGKHLGIFTERHDITTKGESLNDGARYNADERTRAVSTFLEAIGVASHNEDDTG